MKVGIALNRADKLLENLERYEEKSYQKLEKILKPVYNEIEDAVKRKFPEVRLLFDTNEMNIKVYNVDKRRDFVSVYDDIYLIVDNIISDKTTRIDFSLTILGRETV